MLTKYLQYTGIALTDSNRPPLRQIPKLASITLFITRYIKTNPFITNPRLRSLETQFSSHNHLKLQISRTKKFLLKQQPCIRIAFTKYLLLTPQCVLNISIVLSIILVTSYNLLSA